MLDLDGLIIDRPHNPPISRINYKPSKNLKSELRLYEDLYIN